MRQALHSRFAVALLAVALLGPSRAEAKTKAHAPDPATPTVDDYRITVLSEAIPGRTTVGEWGFSALVEVTAGGVTRRFLFDTGDKPGTVLFNAGKLGIDLCGVEDVVLSHHHADHIGGLVNLRTTCMVTNPAALSRVHVGGEEVFWSRRDPSGNEKNPLLAVKVAYEATGGQFVVDGQAHPFPLPGVFLTGHIPRTYDERTYLPATPLQLLNPLTGELGVDLIPEDQALVINGPDAAVVLTGCAHAGAINTLLQAKAILGGEPSFVLAGGLHWFQMERGDKHEVATVDWEAERMRDLKVEAMLGGHCTSFERFFYIRDYLKYDWSQAATAAVGTVLALDPRYTFTLPQALNIPMGSPK